MLYPDIIFSPMSILKQLHPDEQESEMLSFTNNTGSTLNYNITYPDTLEWISLSGTLTGTLPAGGNGNITVHFDSEGIISDTLLTYLTFIYGIDSLFKVPAHLYVDPFVNIDEQASRETGIRENIEIRPNPAREVVRFKFSGLSERMDSRLYILNTSGNILHEFIIPDGQTNTSINVETFSPGIYTALLKQGSQIQDSKKFIILK